MNEEDEALFDSITKVHLKATCIKHGTLSRNNCTTKSTIIAAIREMEADVVDRIRVEIRTLIQEGKGKYRRSDGNSGRASKRQRMEHEEELQAMLHAPIESFADVAQLRIEEIITGDFLRAATEEELKDRTARFIDATGNIGIRCKTCGSCARDRVESDVTTMLSTKIPNKEQLYPATPHPAHVLIHGMLVHKGALSEDKRHITICNECMNSLKRNCRPKFSLANNLWIGDVPAELSDLTLAEKVLISKYFCAAYVIKLYPKIAGAKSWGKADQMHNALRGNVSTYKLDPNQVAAMLQGGRVYLPNAMILAATIGVTFVRGQPLSAMLVEMDTTGGLSGYNMLYDRCS